MQSSNAFQYAQSIDKELDQFNKNEIWIITPKSEIQPGHLALGGKWVYKVKQDVNRDIAWFKAKSAVESYIQQLECILIKSLQ